MALPDDQFVSGPAFFVSASGASFPDNDGAPMHVPLPSGLQDGDVLLVFAMMAIWGDDYYGGFYRGLQPEPLQAAIGDLSGLHYINVLSCHERWHSTRSGGSDFILRRADHAGTILDPSDPLIEPMTVVCRIVAMRNVTGVINYIMSGDTVVTDPYPIHVVSLIPPVGIGVGYGALNFVGFRQHMSCVVGVPITPAIVSPPPPTTQAGTINLPAGMTRLAGAGGLNYPLAVDMLVDAEDESAQGSINVTYTGTATGLAIWDFPMVMFLSGYEPVAVPCPPFGAANASFLHQRVARPVATRTVTRPNVRSAEAVRQAAASTEWGGCRSNPVGG